MYNKVFIFLKKNLVLKHLLTLVFVLLSFTSISQDFAITKYKNGDSLSTTPKVLPNLISFSNKNINTKISRKLQTFEVDVLGAFQFPIFHTKENGSAFSGETEIEDLKNHLFSVGSFHIYNNYYLEPFITKEQKKIFSKKNLVVLPRSHLLFNICI